MKKLYKRFLYLAFIIYAVTYPKVTHADQINIVFPSCLNPGISADITYTSGTHGIAGDNATYSGSDNVYKLEANTRVLQCFCGSNGQGIQTNWIKVDAISQEQLQSLIRQGWVEIPFGTDWGLDNSAYLAKNDSYACIGTALVQSATAINTNSSASQNNNSAAPGNNSVFATLASTGNIISFFLTLSAGVLLLILGLMIRKYDK